MKKLFAPYKDPNAPLFLTAMAIFGIAAGLYMGVLNNYLADILNITRAERGIIELPRELPGLLLIFIIALLYNVCETRILRIAFAVSLAGVVGIIFLGETRSTAIVMIVLWSAGEHIMMPLRRSISIHMAHKEKQGLAMGLAGSAGAVGSLLGHYMIPLIFIVVPRIIDRPTPFTSYKITFIIAGIILLGGIALSLRIPVQNHHIKRNRLYFRKKFSKYYILEIFFGARKQVFITFAPYVLIKLYDCDAKTMGLLFGFSSTVNIFAAPYIGRIIDRTGYRTIIIIDTIILIALCFLYGFSHLMLQGRGSAAFILVCIVFIIDSVLFSAGMARTMYVKSISESQEEVTSTLSTGISINHLISIVIAITGGIIWETFGIQTLFSIAALFGLGSFFFSLTLPRQK